MYSNTKFNSFSFGCRVNEAERVEIDDQMIKAGYSKSSDKPDIYILNTCAVTTKAEREARQLILRLKRANPSLKVVVTGCSATYWSKNKLWTNMPIDLIISNINKEYLVSIVSRWLKTSSSKAPLSTASVDNGLIQRGKFVESGRIMIKIQDGCHRFCSYCIVPYLRGTAQSYKLSEIISRIQSLPYPIQEVIYTAINTESFGKDTHESLIDLIDASLRQTSIPRISFGSIHPWSINKSFIEYYEFIKDNKRFSHFFHVPIQSGSDKILSLMKREYKAQEIIENVRELKKIDPNTFISTDIIVGFLEETDKDFEDTYKTLLSSPFDRFHIFRFSLRQNTAAYFMKKRLYEPTEGIKRARAKILGTLSNSKYMRLMQSLVSTYSDALFIGDLTNGYQQAVLNNQISVWVKVAKNIKKSIKRVKVIRLSKNKLLAKLA